ncbi:SsgA family sporulation/cell division regulator [Kitasatospora cheerisanensis]|uniref:Putative sporulation and cell division protein n=1 Tax=Kitasatospora cheerisanensis KCTC 2395 TaxID=1348663 RepID=A0A066YUJ3_9ACTN|nr:SsgA family sporulation/cell division regulator [Kitasatospora cheerisanensis]KDN85183.1 putative sporulation and cell division protein [Kitasatospora cheerisanensis KCTC 2395]
MSAAPAPVEQTVQARLILGTHRSALLRVTLRYRCTDPLAVRMAFPAEYALDAAEPDPYDPNAPRDPHDPFDPVDAAGPAGPEIEWVFARQLLAAGLDLPAGEGDVRIRPAFGLRTMVELRSPEGVALLQFARNDLRRFLWRSHLAVPEGQELRHLDCDRALAQLLA